jgi:ABC-type lipoprotein export system ATPase subunit
MFSAQGSRLAPLSRLRSHAAVREGAVAQSHGAEVRLQHVSKSYGPITAVRDANLRVAGGEFVLIAGRSGSGKSTLLNLIGGLEDPDSGQVLIDGGEVWRGGHLPRHRRELVGFVFQRHLLLTQLTAQGNVEAPLIAAGIPRAERARRARALLREVGLIDRARHRPSQLSGGERQRVAVARALIGEPRLLLADEPTGALDSNTSERLLQLLVQVRDQRQMTMIVVSYDPLMGAHADRTLNMIDGVLSVGGGAAGSMSPQSLRVLGLRTDGASFDI